MSIRFQLDDECPTPFAAIIYGEHVKIVKNPRLCASMPFWLQEYVANDTLRSLTPPPPKHLRQRAAEIVHIETLRDLREARSAAGKGRSSSV